MSILGISLLFCIPGGVWEQVEAMEGFKLLFTVVLVAVGLHAASGQPAGPALTGNLKLSAFNIQIFGVSKSNKPEVMEILSRVSLVAARAYGCKSGALNVFEKTAILVVSCKVKKSFSSNSNFLYPLPILNTIVSKAKLGLGSVSWLPHPLAWFVCFFPH